MSEALKRLQELKARTKAPCINPDCQDGHMCNVFGECCAGCYATGEARRHLSNLRIEYFEMAVEALQTGDVLRRHELAMISEEEHWCEFCFDCGVLFDSRRIDVLSDIEEDAKRALEGK